MNRDDWFKYGRCRDMDTEKFFPAEEGSQTARAAVAECRKCDVKQWCLAENFDCSDGVFGATEASERRNIRKLFRTPEELAVDEWLEPQHVTSSRHRRYKSAAFDVLEGLQSETQVVRKYRLNWAGLAALLWADGR